MTEDEKYLKKLQKDRQRDRKQARWGRKIREEGGISSLKSLMKGFFQNDPELQNRFEEQSAMGAWPGIVGGAAAKISHPLRIRNQILVVQVSDVLWLQQLTFLKTSLLRHYQKEFPSLKLKDIYFTQYA